MQTIYNYLIRDLYFSWGGFINSLFLDSQIVLYFFLFVIFCFLVYKLQNNNLKKLFVILILAGIGLYVTLIIPFYKGRLINLNFGYGKKLISSIEEYKKVNNFYPDSLGFLTIKNLESNTSTNLDKGFSYIPYYTKYGTVNKPLPETRYIHNYSLNLKIPHINSPLYTYDKVRHSFTSD